MDFYYRKSMGNGTIASKFRLNSISKGTETPPNKRLLEVQKEATSSSVLKTSDSSGSGTNDTRSGEKQPSDGSSTTQRNNCNRCYRLKKKCSRSFPKCDNCEKSGSDCTYIERQLNRRKKSDFRNANEGATVSPVPAGNSTEILQIVDDNDSKNKESMDRERIVAQKLVPVNSLLSSESGENSRGRETKRRRLSFKQRPIQRRESSERSADDTNDRLIIKSLQKQHNSNLKEEFITMRAVDKEELPRALVMTYFENFEYRYPFLDKEKFMASFDKLDFKTETIVGLDVHLLMAIGSVVYDSVNKSDVFNSYFNESVVTSVIDVLNFQLSMTSEEGIEHLEILLLLAIYARVSINEDLCWGVLGVLDRIIVQTDMYKQEVCNTELMKRIFWSIYAMDKEFSLLKDKPSQLPSLEIVDVPTVLDTKLFQSENLNVINSGIQLSILQDRLLDLKLKRKSASAQLTELSNSIEKWRVQASSSIHNDYAQSPYLHVHVSCVNYQYYYMLIESDQISSSESFQFTLHFLSNSFTLLMTDNSKTGVEVSINDLYWYKMLFNVISYNLASLADIFEPQMFSKTDSSLKLGEFNGNLQLIINLLKFVDRHTAKPSVAFAVSSAIRHLTDLNSRLVNFNHTTSASQDLQGLCTHISKLRSSIMSAACSL